MPGDRAAGGVFLWLPFFAQALRRRSGANSAAGGGAAEGRMPGVKKVTRSPQASGSFALCDKEKGEERDSGLRRDDETGRERAARQRRATPQRVNATVRRKRAHP
jgi:hypothetical protein